MTALARTDAHVRSRRAQGEREGHGTDLEGPSSERQAAPVTRGRRGRGPARTWQGSGFRLVLARLSARGGERPRVCAGSSALDLALTCGLDPRTGLRPGSKRLRGSEVTGGGKGQRNQRALYGGVSGAGAPRGRCWLESPGPVLPSASSSVAKGQRRDEPQSCARRSMRVKHEEHCLPRSASRTSDHVIRKVLKK